MTIAELFAAVLRIPARDVDDETAPRNTASWTSMAHIELVVALEEVYGVSLSSLEIQRMTSVAEARRILRHKGVDVS
jgi:acyl carrier protein